MKEGTSSRKNKPLQQNYTIDWEFLQGARGFILLSCVVLVGSKNEEQMENENNKWDKLKELAKVHFYTIGLAKQQ